MELSLILNVVMIRNRLEPPLPKVPPCHRKSYWALEILPPISIKPNRVVGHTERIYLFSGKENPISSDRNEYVQLRSIILVPFRAGIRFIFQSVAEYGDAGERCRGKAYIDAVANKTGDEGIVAVPPLARIIIDQYVISRYP